MLSYLKKARSIKIIGSILALTSLFPMFQNADFLPAGAVVLSIAPPGSPPSNVSFPAIGDGRSNDRSAVLAAFNALMAQQGPAILQFEKDKTYYLPSPLANRFTRQNPAPVIFNIDKKKDLTIDGRGSTLLLDTIDDAFSIMNSSNITIKNLKIDYIAPLFSQGTIEQIQATYLDMQLSVGFPAPSSTATNFANASIHDSAGNYLRNINLFVESIQVNPNATNPRLVRIFPDQRTLPELKKISLKSQIALRQFGEVQGRNFYFFKNHNVKLESVTIHSSPNVSVLAKENTGLVELNGVDIRLAAGSPRLLAGLSGGFIFHDNRAKVSITNCLVERNLDDAINLAASAEVSPQIFSTTRFDLRSSQKGGVSPTILVGDKISAYNFAPNASRIFLGEAKILSVTNKDARTRTVTIDTPISGLIALLPETGNAGDQNLLDWNATRFFIDENSNSNFLITNNTFRDKPRSAIIARSTNGLIRANTITNIGGHGIYAANHLTINRGPIANNMEISANTFSGVDLTAIVLGVNVNATNPRPLGLSTDIINNRFSNLASDAIQLVHATNVNISGGVEEYLSLINFNNSTATYAPATSLFKITGSSEIYFSSGLTFCQYKSMAQMTSIWGSGYLSYLSETNHLPTGRTFAGICSDTQGIAILENGGIYQELNGQQTCTFNSMQRFNLLTGFEFASSLPIRKTAPVNTTDAGRCRL